jgi:hypothetical protein
MKMRKFKLVNVFLLTLSLVLTISLVSSATTDYCVNAVVGNVTPSSINIGDEFTIGIVIDNCGLIPAQNIIFELRDISPYIELKEPLRLEIGSMGYQNSERFIIYHMKVKEDASPGNYKFNYKLSYDNGNATKLNFYKDGSFYVTVIGNHAEIDIASSKTKPVLPKIGETTELTLRIENFGKGNAESVKVSVDYPFAGTKEAFIGKLEPDEDGPAIFTFIPDKKGEFIVPISVYYKDDFGEQEYKTTFNLIVLKKDLNIQNIIFTIIILLLIIGGIFYFFRVKKAQEKIIQQLLRGDHSKKKK